MQESRLPKPQSRIYPLHKLKDFHDRNLIQLDTDYQRGVVWSSTKMSELIDSLMNNYYIPPLIFSNRFTEDGRFIRSCVDGKQRLTSIFSFMENKIPFIDNSSEDGPVDRYYCEDLMNGASTDTYRQKYFLTEEQREMFNDCELMCVEYDDIDEDVEVDIFSRVQLGVPISPAERLKAYRSPRADFCKKLYEKYRERLSKFFPDLRGSTLRSIAQIASLVNEDGDKYDAGINHIQTFLKSSETLDPDVEHRIKNALEILVRLMEARPDAFERVDSQGIKSMHLVYYSLFLALCRRRRTFADLAGDLLSLRKYLQERLTTATISGKSFKIAKEWIDTRLDELSAVPANVRPIHPPANGIRGARYEEPPIDVRNSAELPPRKRQREETRSADSVSVDLRSSARRQHLQETNMEIEPTDPSPRKANGDPRLAARRLRGPRMPVVKNEATRS